MPIPRKYESPRLLFNKLKQQAAYLEEEVTWERFNDFAVPAYHLGDWILTDPAATPDMLRDVGKLRDSLEIQACRDRANSYKHRKLTKYPKKAPPQTLDTTVQQGYGVGRYGRGGYGIGEEQVTITMKDGTVYDGLALARQVVKLWEEYFTQYPQLLNTP